MKIFVVIVTYNGQEWYQRCFDSLLASHTPLEVVIVDNSPNDDTAFFLQNHYPAFHLIKNSENIGFGKANNLGIKYALDNGADYVFLLNQDTWLTDKTTVGHLLDICTARPEFGIISPIHLNARQDGIEQLLAERLLLRYQTKNWCAVNTELLNDLYFNRLKDIYSVPYINAASWFMPRSTLESIGGFDPIFFHYGEDDNYLQRLVFHDKQLGVCPHLHIVHDNERPRPLYEEHEEEVLMLINYCNINNAVNLKKEMNNARRKFISNLLKMNTERATYWRNRLVFLKQNRSAIEFSRQNNAILKKSF